MNLYDQALLDHNRNPRNFRSMPGATHYGEADNPLCGDHIAVFLRIEDGIVAEASFQGKACAVAMASASLMTVALQGEAVEEVKKRGLFMKAFLNGRAESAPLDSLAMLGRVRDYPIRIGCAELPWTAVAAALEAPISD